MYSVWGSGQTKPSAHHKTNNSVKFYFHLLRSDIQYMLIFVAHFVVN